MKIIGILLTSMLIFSACNKDDILELLPEMSATIDGSEWKSITRITFQEDGKFNITGTSAPGETMNITVFGTTAGTYELSVLSPKCAAVYKESVETVLDDAYLAFSGSVDLSEVNSSNKTITGTFNFSVVSLTDTISITNGKFSGIKYTVKSGS